MSLPKVTEPVQAWMLLSDAGCGSFLIWEITVVSGPKVRQRQKTYMMKSDKKLIWSFQDQKEFKSKRQPPEFVYLGYKQIAFTPEELRQKFEEGRTKFAKYKKGDVARTISNIEFVEKELAVYRKNLERCKQTEEEIRQLTFEKTGIKP